MTIKTKFISILDDNKKEVNQGLDWINPDHIVRIRELTLKYDAGNKEYYPVEISLANGDKVIAYCGDKDAQKKLMHEILYQENHPSHEDNQDKITVFDY